MKDSGLVGVDLDECLSHFVKRFKKKLGSLSVNSCQLDKIYLVGK